MDHCLPANWGWDSVSDGSEVNWCRADEIHSMTHELTTPTAFCIAQSPETPGCIWEIHCTQRGKLHIRPEEWLIMVVIWKAFPHTSLGNASNLWLVDSCAGRETGAMQAASSPKMQKWGYQFWQAREDKSHSASLTTWEKSWLSAGVVASRAHDLDTKNS